MGAQPRQMHFPKVVCIGAGNIGAGWVAHFLRAVGEIKGGFVADGGFVPSDELVEAYAEEVKSTIGSAGQLPLIETRTEGVIGIRRALEFAKNEHLAKG